MGVSKSCAVPISASSVLRCTGTGQKLTAAGANNARKSAARELPHLTTPVSGPEKAADALPGTTKKRECCLVELQ
jgi:hypothetical protein